VLSEKTGVVQISLLPPDDSGVPRFQVKHKFEDRTEDEFNRTGYRDFENYPVPVPDSRCLFYQIRRPGHSSFPYHFIKGTSDEDKLLREAIAKQEDSSISAAEMTPAGSTPHRLSSTSASEHFMQQPIAASNFNILPEVEAEKQADDWFNVQKMMREKNVSIDEKVKSTLDKMSVAQARSLCSHIWKRNGYVVEINEVITTCTCSNTANLLLGSREQSIAVAFYLIDYITKDASVIAEGIAVIADAILYVK